jgi:hypothetical protein
MSQGQRIKFFGTQFSVVTAWGSTNAVTSISNANPAVVSDTGHGIADNAVVRVGGAVGMEEINGLLAVVEVVDANSYRLLGIDSTNYGAYVSGGSVQVATFSSSCEVSGYTGDSGTTTETETETNCGKAIDFGSPDPGAVSIQYNHAPTDFQEALEASRKAVSTIALRTTLPNSKGIMIDIGTVTQVGRSASAGGMWAGSATIRRVTDRFDLEA